MHKLLIALSLSSSLLGYDPLTGLVDMIEDTNHWLFTTTNLTPREPQEVNKTTTSSGDSSIHCPVDFQAVSEWINVINIGSFFDNYHRYILNNTQCFVTFDTFDQLSVWGESYGYYVRYNSSLGKDQKLDFTSGTAGLGIGGTAFVIDDLYLGGGFGYFFSNVSPRFGDRSHVNGLYFGPSAQYRYTDGWVGLTLIGVGNFFGKNDRQSWDLDVRAETEYCIDAPVDFFIPDLTIHPFLQIDYTNVFELKQSDTRSHHSSFFYSKLGSRLERVIYCTSSGIVALSIDLGWINMTPLTSYSIKCQNGDVLNQKPESKNQLALGCDVIGMSYMGWLIALEYQAALGSNAPIQSGKVRFEWNW